MSEPHWKKYWPGFTFNQLLCMYISDCLGYLRGGLVPFEHTEDEDLIYYGLRELKDECIKKAGLEPMDWKGN